jgi:hypothetical protein
VKEACGAPVNHDAMKQSRLVRLLHLLTLYRRCAATLLITSRHIFPNSKRASAQLHPEYLRMKSDMAETQATVARMLAGIITA